jgi:hypothetical protein
MKASFMTSHFWSFAYFCAFSQNAGDVSSIKIEEHNPQKLLLVQHLLKKLTESSHPDESQAKGAVRDD